jgi:hypothetical protein
MRFLPPKPPPKPDSRRQNWIVGQEKMCTDLTRCLAAFLFAIPPAMIAAQESTVKTSAGLRLVEADSENATRMLQFHWSGPTDSAPREDLFWFAEVMTKEGDVMPFCRTAKMACADGPDGWSNTSIGVKEVSATHVIIEVHCTKGRRAGAEEPSVKEVDQVVDIPLRNVGTTTQGKIKFTARWWVLAQPIRAPEPRSGRSKMEASSGAAR